MIMILRTMPLWRGGPNTRTLPTVLLTPSASKAADMAHLCVPQNQALGVCRGFVPDIQICGTHGRTDLVNATIISNAEEEEDDNDNCIQRRSSRCFTISSLCRELSPTRTFKWPWHNRVKVTCNTSNAYHVQRVVCHLVRRDSSAIEFDRVEITFILALLY